MVTKLSLWEDLRAGPDQPLGKPGKCPGPRAWIPKTLLLVFHVFRLFITRQNGRAFWLLRL